MHLKSLLLFAVCGVLFSIAGTNAFLNGEGIIGGRDVVPLEFPYVVSIRNGTGHHLCGGGIIANQYVLTAAHCFLNFNPEFDKFAYTIVGGITNLKDKENVQTRVEVEIEKAYIPNAYNQSLWDSKAAPFGDIAVLKLKSKLDIEINPGLSILDLPKKNTFVKPYIGVKAILAGFGVDEIGSNGYKNSGQLHKANVLILKRTVCNGIYNATLYNSQLCAKLIEHTDRLKVQGFCQTDSGSPLVVDNTVIGVTSATSFFCNDWIAPGVYTKVISHLDFIKNSLKDIVEGINVIPTLSG